MPYFLLSTVPITIPWCQLTAEASYTTKLRQFTLSLYHNIFKCPLQQVNKHRSQTQAIKQSGKTKTEKLDKANLMGNNSKIDRELGQELCTTYNQSP
jgi:hypothetical protein